MPPMVHSSGRDGHLLGIVSGRFSCRRIYTIHPYTSTVLGGVWFTFNVLKTCLTILQRDLRLSFFTSFNTWMLNSQDFMVHDVKINMESILLVSREIGLVPKHLAPVQPVPPNAAHWLSSKKKVGILVQKENCHSSLKSRCKRCW